MAHSDSPNADRGATEGLMRKNLMVLCRLFKQSEGAFGYRMYIDDLPGRLLDDLQIPHVTNLFRTILPHMVVARHTGAKMDPEIDLKYNGHSCVGLCKYISETMSTNGCLSNMARSSLEYMMRLQGDSGALACRFVHGNAEKYGTDRRSIAESSEAFLWALTASMELFREERSFHQELVERARRATMWLMNNEEYLSPQEIGRLIYGCSQLYTATRERTVVSWISRIAESLIQRLGDLKSFGLFPDDIDAIGGLSLAFRETGKKIFLEIATRLAHNQLASQGPVGEWRWAFNREDGRYKKLLDLTYTVHQLGMAPWGFSQYVLASSRDGNRNVVERVMKGIMWISRKKAFTDEFIVRSYSGLTGRIYELEQRSYEPGLNILGLLSCSVLKGWQIKAF